MVETAEDDQAKVATKQVEWKAKLWLVLVALGVNILLQFFGGLIFYELEYPAEVSRAESFLALEQVETCLNFASSC